jgi:energy-coupling factor transporter transmembrane protein EcfT
MHVIVKLLSLILLAFLLTTLYVSQLVWLVIALLSISFSVNQFTLLNMLRRVRWLLIVLVLVYAFAAPGEYMQIWRFRVKPTYEGVTLGLTHALNIVSMLAGLSLVLATTSRSKLIGGIYQLFKPLKYLGLNAEKFAVRIWLTLDYAEARQSFTFQHLKAFRLDQALEAHLSESKSSPDQIAIEVYSFKLFDWIVSGLILLGLTWLMVK